MACIPPLRITAYTNTSQAHTDVKIKLTVAEHLKLIFKILAICKPVPPLLSPSLLY
jgi:hypothetical protein